MRLEAHRSLARLREAVGMDHGKCVQKLLALAFLEAGATRVTDRGVQGIDLEVTLADGRRVALEVKTTEGEAVSLGPKDLEGLESRRAEGFAPYVAVLGPHLLDDWVFARVAPGEIRPKEAYAPTALRAYRDRALERVVATTFPAVVVAHASAAAEGGQAALNALLEAHRGFARA
jgi:hypothetical protein